MEKKTMFGIIQVVNIGDILSTYAFYRLAGESFIEVSPFFSLTGENIYFFLGFKYLMLLFLSIGVYLLFSKKYFIVFYLIVYSLYAYAIAHNLIMYNMFETFLLSQ